MIAPTKRTAHGVSGAAKTPRGRRGVTPWFARDSRAPTIRRARRAIIRRRSGLGR